MAKAESLQKARLIPVSGIGSIQEAEQRATSALLAVMSIVRDLSIELLAPLGAPRAQKARVESFIEVQLPSSSGKRIRPDGLIRVSYGSRTWQALVEVKTGANALEAEQVNAYWELARENKLDLVLTISNEIAPRDGVHPTAGLKVMKSAKVKVAHLSWSAIITAATRIKRHKGISDPEQAWLLEELIRYLHHQKSGALAFDDMGPNWVAVRDGARMGTLSKTSEDVKDIVSRWDQLLRFAALQLSAEIGDDVDPVIPRGQSDIKIRRTALANELTTTGQLTGALSIPNTAGNIDIRADLKARQIIASIEVAVPQDKGAKGRVSWLVNQIEEAPPDLVIETYAKNAKRSSGAATLDQVREDRYAPLDVDRTEPHRFHLILRREMGMNRSGGKRSPGFIDSVLSLINVFYGTVVQDIVPWQRPAPKLTKPAPEADESEAGVIEEPPISSWFQSESRP